MPICSLTFDTLLLHFVGLCTFVRIALITVDEIWYFLPRGWDELATRKLKSGILGEIFYLFFFFPQVIKYDALAQGNCTDSFKRRRRGDNVQRPSSIQAISDSLPLAASFFSYTLVHRHINIQRELLRSHTDTNINACTRSVSWFQKWNYSISQGSC